MPNANDLSHPNLIHRYSANSISGSTLTDLKGSANATLVNTSIVTVDGEPYININGVDAYIDYGFLTNRPQAKLPVTLYIKFRLPDTSRRNPEWVIGSTAASAQSGFLIAYDDRRLSGGDALATTRRFRVARYIGDSIVIDESGYTNDGLFDIDGPLGIGLISDGTTQQVAVNDQLFNPITLSASSSASQTRHTASGAWLNPSASTFGRLQISDVFVFDRALTQAEIAELYEGDDSVVASGSIIEIVQSVENTGFISTGVWRDERLWIDTDTWQDYPIGSGSITDVVQRVERVFPAGVLKEIAQTVGIIRSGSLIEIEQAVGLTLRGKGQILAISQEIQAVGSGKLTSIVQRVLDNADADSVPPINIELIIDGQLIPIDQITGDIRIVRAESSAAIMSVTLIPKSGTQDITRYQGKDVTIDYIDGVNTTRIYTGKVDIPEVDLILKTITLRCTDNRTERNNALPRSVVEGIGFYSESVFGEPKDQNDELENRLRTVQAGLDYDASGNFNLTDWEPKQIADFVIDDDGIYRKTPQVEVLSRGRVLNKVNLELTYRFQRLRHRERSWQWNYPWNDNSWCGFLLDNIGLMRTDGIIRAAESAGWAIKDRVETVGLPQTRWYPCGTRTIGWQTISKSCDTAPKLDDDGNQVTDSDGNPVTVSVNCRTVDRRNIYATSAQWTASKRWAQAIEQTINFTVEAPQSIQQYGQVERSERYGYEYAFDTQEWENYRVHQTPNGMVQSANGDFIRDQRATELGEFQDAAFCAIAKARAEIAASHRQNYVTIQVPFMPEVDLKHTIELAAGVIRCKGKVYQITHTISSSDKFAETQIQIALSRSVGNVTPTGGVVLQYPSTSDAPTPVQTITLGNWIGGRGPDELPDTANGFVTNYVFNRPRKLYTESFIVDAPAIEDGAREMMQVDSEQTFIDAVRNDYLEVVFDD
jgi:hypothetical protein